MPIACNAEPFSATMASPAARAPVSMHSSSDAMRRWRSSTCSRWLSLNFRHSGFCQREDLHSSGDTPCAAAAAAASRHSRSLHFGVALPGCTSSAASVSVVRRKPSLTILSGGSMAQRLGMILLRRGRRGGVFVAMCLLAGDQRMPARIERRTVLAVTLRFHGGLRLLQGDLLMQQVAHAAIEVRVVGAAEHHGQVAAILPVRL